MENAPAISSFLHYLALFSLHCACIVLYWICEEIEMTDQMQSDVDLLVAAYKEDGKKYMLCKLSAIMAAKDLKYWEAIALLDSVWLALVPGNDRAARLARMKLIKA
jgi:hypothetical protein